MPSSVIADFSYIEKDKILVIRYQSGLVYRYLKVPQQVYQRMKAAFSKGVFLNKFIKGSYEFERLE